MKFKVDENLPVEAAEILHSANYDVLTIFDQGMKGEKDENIADVCLTEGRILVTLDIDFADIYTYPPEKYPGFIVFRLHYQDKQHILSTLQSIIPYLEKEPIEHRLWIVEETRIRIRGGV